MTQLYLDCDGVLADFDRAFEETFGHPARAHEEQHGSNKFWRDIQREAPTFYRDLPLMPGAGELYGKLAVFNPTILTGCPAGGWAESQKIAWAGEHFPGVPVITCAARHKFKHCAPGDILIDDRPKYRHLWESAGGIFIVHVDVESSIEQFYAAWLATGRRRQA